MTLVERGGLVEDLVEPVAPLSRRFELGRHLLVLELHPEALGEPFHRPGEVQLLGLADELDQVAAGAAAEAVVELVHCVDGEARRPFLVERTAACVPGADLPELCPPGNHVDHVGRGDHPLLRVLGEPRHYSRSA